MNSNIKVFNEINQLSNVTRWSRMHCTKPENVLEHTAFVAMYSLSLCYKHGIDPGITLQKAVLHDIEEGITGDIPTPTKYYSKEIRESIGKMEDEAARTILLRSFYCSGLHEWKEAKNTDTPSGSIVAIADCAAVVYKIRQEVELGNSSFLEICTGIKSSLTRLYGCHGNKFNVDITNLIEEVHAIENIK